MAQASIPPTRDGDPASPETVRAAFRELHGRRLHGFALLLTLGERALAAAVTADAISAGADRVDELRHPERAAAWLRSRVLRSMPRRPRPPSPSEERAALEALDVDTAVVDGLAALSMRERAALVASDIERLDTRDVEVVVGRHGSGLERLLARARRRYVSAHASLPLMPDGRPDGPLVRRIRAVAARTMT